MLATLGFSAKPETFDWLLKKMSDAELAQVQAAADRAAHDRAQSVIAKSLAAMGRVEKISQITTVTSSGFMGAKHVSYFGGWSTGRYGRNRDRRDEYFKNVNDKNPVSFSVFANGRSAFSKDPPPNYEMDFNGLLFQIANTLTAYSNAPNCLSTGEASGLSAQVFVSCGATTLVFDPRTSFLTMTYTIRQDGNQSTAQYSGWAAADGFVAPLSFWSWTSDSDGRGSLGPGGGARGRGSSGSWGVQALRFSTQPVDPKLFEIK